MNSMDSEKQEDKIKVIASFHVLMNLAGNLGRARLSGDIDKIKEAEKEHDEYRDVCLKADLMSY